MICLKTFGRRRLCSALHLSSTLVRNDADRVGMVRDGYHCEGRGLAWPGLMLWRRGGPGVGGWGYWGDGHGGWHSLDKIWERSDECCWWRREDVLSHD